MQKNEYNNYYKNHGGYGHSEHLDMKVLDIRIRNFKCNFGSLLKSFNKNACILEIGCGQGYFAEYLRQEGFLHYTGFDFDSDVIQADQSFFPEYHFSDEDVGEFLKKNHNTFDIIFMSHVYEHMSVDDGTEIAKNIYQSLRKDGIWLNIMPNAASLFSATHARYVDLTHKTLYSSMSMSQQLLSSGFRKEDIIHRNTIFPYVFFDYYQRFIRFTANILFRSLGYMNDVVTTFEIITIAKK